MGKQLAFTLMLFCFVWHVMVSQNTQKAYYPSFFDSDEVLKVSLYFDVTSHVRKKSEDYCSSKIVIYNNDSDSTTFDVRCRARGNYRKENCFFPPVMLNFKPDSLFTSDGFVTKLKLVTHCVNSKTYQEYMYEELLVYKLWEVISPYALRTRLLDVHYFDMGERGKNYHGIGFFIEPVNMMARRNNADEVKGEYFHEAVINSLDADRVAFFNYMIGNTDWRIKSGHNIKFIKHADGREEITPIPFDFDHSGFVNTAYAMPSEWSSAEAVTERDYVGRCRNYDDNYYTLIDEFLAKEEDVYATILNFEPLEMKKRKQLYKYIAKFYKELRKPEVFINTIHNSCMDRY